MYSRQEIESLKTSFEKVDQGHVFEHISDLNSHQIEAFIHQLKSVNIEELSELIKVHLIEDNKDSDFKWESLKPAPCITSPAQGGDLSHWHKAHEIGEQAIAAGRVAAFTVAGGQGTRLGFDGPKGIFALGLCSGKSLFEIFADKIYRASQRYNVKIPWFIMTSELNYAATIEAFENNDYYGLDKDTVTLFKQELVPAIDLKGKIILENKGQIAMTPNGHGGSLRALSKNGATEKMRTLGIDILSYFQVDNPLVSCIDPSFIGFHLMHQSELSSKMIPKAYAAEKVGMFCEYNGKLAIVEYSDMPQKIKDMEDANGDLLFRAGNVAIHLFDREFIDRVGGLSSDEKLPFHKASKKIPYYDQALGLVQPKESNGIKFEMFVFDALPKSKNPIVVEGSRSENFSPVKNVDGVDSPKTCKQDLLKQAVRWLSHAGKILEVDANGFTNFNFEINYRFAMDRDDFAEQWKRLEPKPEIEEGTIIGS
tara:strand:- start:640 stop:2082 length:1443 start_codon:yes stop_codon:yes gene_type:complete